MRKILGLAAVTLFCVGTLHAKRPSNADYLANETGIAYSTTFGPMDTQSLGNLSVQAVWSSATIAAITFTDGIASTGTITISSYSAVTRIAINNCVFDPGNQYTPATSNTATALALAAAINSNTCLGGLIISTNVAGVVYATATTVGTGTNYTLYSASAAAATLSGALMTGGAATAVSLSADTIASTNHGITTGLPLLYTTTAGTAPTPLVANTTYYGIRTSANAFQLARTSTGAVVALAIDITTTTQAGGGTFKVTPLAIAGTPSFKIQVSNDNANWFDLNVASVTYSAAPSSTFWDLGTPSYQWLRINYTAGTAGALNLKIKAFGKE